MKAKILAICPYEALRDMIVAAVRDRDDIELVSMLGDISEGEKLIDRVRSVTESYDIIISRGGTCRMLRPLVSVPVLEIKSSGFDILRVVRLMKSYTGKFAIVGYPSTMDSARLINDLMEIQTDIFTYTSHAEAEECIRTLRDMKYDLVVGGVTTVLLARALGMNSILIPSGVESVRDTLDEAVRLCAMTEWLTSENRLLKAALTDESRQVMIYDRHLKPVYCSSGSDSHLDRLLDHPARTALEKGSVSLLSSEKSGFRQLKARCIKENGQKYVLASAMPCHSIKSGPGTWIRTKGMLESDSSSFNALYTCSDSVRKLVAQAEIYAGSRSPVLIFGEEGSGKTSLVSHMHAASPACSNTLVVIDVPSGNRDHWHHLLESPDSPLYQLGCEICLNNVQETPAYIRQPLMDYLRSAVDSASNRLYFTWTRKAGEQTGADSLEALLVDELGAVSLAMPPLRERRDDIPGFASIIINECNVRYGKQIFGITDDALQLLKSFPWPHNFIHLKQLFREAVLLTDGSLISANTVKDLLQKIPVTSASASTYQLDLNKTLEEINDDIIKIVLQEENFNYTRIAARLGISRSSLWRKTRNK